MAALGLRCCVGFVVVVSEAYRLVVVLGVLIVVLMPKVAAMLDKLAKKNIIHSNKAANLKSGLAVYVNKLA